MDSSTHRTGFGPILEVGPARTRADHATAFLLEFLEVRPGEKVVEPGCGGGLLSLYCRLAGASRVLGTDTDPVCIEAARENTRVNHLDRIEFALGDLLAPLDFQPDLVVANLPHRPCPTPIDPRYCGGFDGTDLVLRLIEEAGVRLATGGRLVLFQNGIANPTRVLSKFQTHFEVTVLAEKIRRFQAGEFDTLAPGLHAHLEQQRARGEAEYFQDHLGEFFLSRIYQGEKK